MSQNKYNNNIATQELAECIAKDRPILMTGAGLSRLVGYPSWYDLMLELRSVLGSEVDVDDELLVNKEYDKYAEKLLSKSIRQTDLFPFIKERFGPERANSRYDELHLELVGLPFCGLVTTNYDRVLEDATQAHLYKVMGAKAPGCKPRDLCYDEHGTFVFDFIRRLARSSDMGCRDEILHLHGYYEHPKHIILTDSDYSKRYGRMLPGSSSQGSEVTIHHKVLWSLLVTHPFVFFGFSMYDPYFIRITEIIKKEFELGSTYVKNRHYAVLPMEKVDEALTERLKSAGILPVLYEMPSEGEDRYKKGLLSFLKNLQANMIGSGISKFPQEESDLQSEIKEPDPVQTEDEIQARDITLRMLKKYENSQN